MRQRTATYTYEDDEQNAEYEVELEYDIHPAEPDVGIMFGGFEVTGIADVNGVVYIDDLGAELKPSEDSRTGWESVIRRRLMAKYAERGPVADAMEKACGEQETADYEDAMESRAEAERERRWEQL